MQLKTQENCILNLQILNITFNMHPLIENLEKLKEVELETKIQELSKKYFQAHNGSVKHQITMVIDMYRAELDARRAKQWQEQHQKRDTDLDSLINVS